MSVDERPVRECVEALLSSCVLLRLDERIVGRAAALEPARLRSLDAIHLASALELGEDCERFVAYDRALLRGAHGAGLSTASPGAPRP